MILSEKDLKCIYTMGSLVSAADGKIDPKEVRLMYDELLKFGYSSSEAKSFWMKANEISGTDALAWIAQMGDTQKRYVASYLCAICVSDGHIDDDEVAMVRFISEVCELPAVIPSEAKAFLNSVDRILIG